MTSLDPTRGGRIDRAIRETFDILIIGGGIVGACLARDAAFRGYSVLLLEAVDYAFGTSSRSSKFLHGGIRYLEQGDIGLVREALLERDIVLSIAPHICRSQRAIFPAVPGRTRPAWQLKIGFTAYDLLATDLFRGKKSAFPPHERLGPDSETARIFKHLGLEFSALFAYSDGQMDDTRLVIENILDATELGAVTLNHARVTSLTRSAPGWEAQWEDVLGKAEHRARARYVINAAGPWAERVENARTPGSATFPRIRYSRGTHLLFDAEWRLPGLTIPTGIPGRVYFVWPYFSPSGRGVLVGPTDNEVPENEDNPQANESEIEELLAYLKRDLPGSGLTREKMFRTFCGMRTLVQAPGPRGPRGPTSAVSRREHFEVSDSAMAILGGKYTTARRTAERALDRFEKELGRGPDKRKRAELRSRILPGASAPHSLRDVALTEQGNDFGHLAQAAEYAVSKEHAATWDDIILRRLVLWGLPLDLGRVEEELKRRLNLV